MQDRLKELPVALFGLGAGAAAALIAATKRPETAALVACGGQFRHRENIVSGVCAAALFLAGYNDIEILDWQRNAIARLPNSTTRQLHVIGWTTDPLADPRAISRVALLARSWFEIHLLAVRNSTPGACVNPRQTAPHNAETAQGCGVAETLEAHDHNENQAE
jgi:hypothetical protein